jgi:CBS domain-containing protein
MDVVDVMTRDVLFVTPDTSVREAARLMIDNRISGLPVVEAGIVVGIISEADYVAQDSASTWVSRVLFKGDEAPLSGIEKVSELMSPNPVTIPSTATVQEAARVMTRRGFKRLPVEEDGRMVGIVTRSDLIRAYVRTDEEVADEARDLIAVLPEPLSGVAVEVKDGIATLTGAVENSEEARMLTRVVKGVEGIGAVDNRLDWEVDSEIGESPWSAFPTEGAPR